MDFHGGLMQPKNLYCCVLHDACKERRLTCRESQISFAAHNAAFPGQHTFGAIAELRITALRALAGSESQRTWALGSGRFISSPERIPKFSHVRITESVI
jgi:hypothetical protein